MLHELIDKEDPRCLYCNSDVDVDLNSTWLPKTNLRGDCETLTCKKCKEVFQIHSLQGDDGHTEYMGFSFSCKNLNVFYSYVESYFDISDKNGKYIFAIPSFSVDFSNKEKLFEKLKTYLIFS